MKDRAAIITNVCSLLSEDDIGAASSVIAEFYPFQSIEKVKKSFTDRQRISVFVRDGFIDRYRGTRLIFPPVLYLISGFLPEQFPSDLHWKMSVSHIAFWELCPTVDHVVPLARGGSHDISNWASCSMLTNRAKDNWLLEELGWEGHDPGDFSQWDGLLNWFVREMEKDTVRSIAPQYCHKWLSIAKPYATQKFI